MPEAIRIGLSIRSTAHAPHGIAGNLTESHRAKRRRAYVGRRRCRNSSMVNQFALAGVACLLTS